VFNFGSTGFFGSGFFGSGFFGSGFFGSGFFGSGFFSHLSAFVCVHLLLVHPPFGQMLHSFSF
jgi:uncharacterized membrane protein